jgi:indole-3-glycerol phosphate synthase
MNCLEEIIAHKRTEVAGKKSAGLAAKLEARLRDLPPSRDFASALSGESVRLIAEIKKASPSAGLIRDPFDPVAIATAYERAGAGALSVLTDERFFQGQLDDLRAVRDATPLPCLRKDFIVDEVQLLEARVAGADAVLLIIAALNDSELRFLYDRARSLDLHVLVEVHDEPELDRGLALGARIIGINNRDLTKMEVTLNTTVQLVPKIPEDRTIVSESGIKTFSDIQMLKMLGVDAVLVGESLLKQENVETAARALMGQKQLTD